MYNMEVISLSSLYKKGHFHDILFELILKTILKCTLFYFYGYN